jgi:flagellar M-ring protein FliF
VASLTTYLTSLDRASRIRLFVGVGVIALLTGAALWWVLTPRQQLLFGNLREADAAEIVATLTEWKVPYKITDGGASITVPSDKVYETRMKLVSAGVPKGGHVGFELFDDADFGVTEFAQRVNYQRALQGEIERTIASLPGVDAARVHLTIQRPGLFVAEREVSKASVSLTLRPGVTVSRAQVNGIQGLVASAVEGLSPGSVVVLGSKGELLSAGFGGDAGATGLDERQEEQGRYEERLRGRIKTLLSQVLHDGQFTVSIDVQLNFDTVREINERLVPQGGDGNGLLTRRRVNSSGSVEPAGRNQNQEEIEYAHSTSREEISRALGRIERISVAVILPPELSDFEVERIRSLVSAAAGIDAVRGDRLEVSRLRGDYLRAEQFPQQRSETAVGNIGQPGLSGAVGSSTPHFGWAKGLLIAALGLLLGGIGMAATQKRPRSLSRHEREAVLAQLRGWLAEGQAKS